MRPFIPNRVGVAIEPVSNFILLERYAPNRTAAEWDAAMAQALANLPVEIIQSTRDQGQALRHHVEKTLGGPHSPDVFHVQQDRVKGTAGALAAKTRQADKALAEALQALTQAAESQPDDHRAADEAPCRIQAQERVASAEVALAEAQAQQAQAQEAIQAISRAYHPYHLDTAQPQSRTAVEQRLAQAFDPLEQLAETASLSPRCGERMAKARRVLTDRLATVTFFIMTVTARIEALDWAPVVASAVLNPRIPALYLQRVAERTQTVCERQRLQQHATVLLNSLNAPESPLTGRPSEPLALIEQMATECADLFQRSSSCVEGRHGPLALHHPHRHRIRPRKLAALTTVHHSFIHRPDGTTPAERFFGRRPADLFEGLLDHVPMPARPAHKRASPSAEKPLLRAVA